MNILSKRTKYSDHVYFVNPFTFFKLAIVLIHCNKFFLFFTQHDLPSLKGSEEDCLADFDLRRDARMNNPGACSLEFLSVMQILTECLLKWDT